MKNKSTEQEIERAYDQRVIKEIGKLAGKKITGSAFIEKVSELVKQRDGELVAKAGVIPKLKAPKCVGTTWKTAGGRQGVN